MRLTAKIRAEGSRLGGVCLCVHCGVKIRMSHLLKKKMVLLPNLVLVQHNPVSMGTRSLRSEDVKQLVGFDE